MAIGTAALIGGGLSLAGGLAGAAEGRKGRDAANRAIGGALAEYQGIKLPEISDMELDLLLPQLVGEYGPEALQALDLGPSAMDNVTIDPALKLQQLQALSQLGELSQGGLTEADKAASRDIQREVAQTNQARQQSILQNLAQRGALGSGMELSARMGAAQQAADAQSRAGDQLAQQAQARALQALMQSGQLAGQVRGQDFSEQSQIASARDAINRFNVQNQQGVMGQNVGERNRAQQMNLAARQGVADAGVNIRNQEQMHNKNLQQQDFGNRMSLADSKAAIYSGQAKNATEAAKNTAAGWGQMGGAGAKIAAAFMK